MYAPTYSTQCSICLENYRLIAATLTAAIEIVRAIADNRVGIHELSDGLEITKSNKPTENTNPPSSIDIRIPVTCPLITVHESDEPTSLSVVIKVPRNVTAPTPVKTTDVHCNALPCVGAAANVGAAADDADIL